MIFESQILQPPVIIFLSSGKGASVVPNVCRLVGRSDGRLVCGTIFKFKSSPLFAYLLILGGLGEFFEGGGGKQ